MTPLVIEFITPSSLLREANRPSQLPIVGDGRPGTLVVFPHGLRVSLPTDQIVFTDEPGPCVRSDSVECSSWDRKTVVWSSSARMNYSRRATLAGAKSHDAP